MLKLTIRPIGRRHPRSSSLPHVDTGPTLSSIVGMLPGSPFLSECQALSAIWPVSPQWYQTGILSASISFLEIGRSHRVPNQRSMLGGGWHPFGFSPETGGWRRKCQTGRCHGEGYDVHSQFFRQNPLACPITNSHLFSNVVNDPTPILTDELLNSCRSCAASASPCVFVIVNWCATGLEPGMPLKHLCTTQALVPEGLLNHCESLRTTYPKIGTKFDAHSLFLSLIHHENCHRSRTRLQTNTCENCPHPPSYVQLGTLTR